VPYAAVVREGDGAKELQAPGGMDGDKLFQKQPAEQPRDYSRLRGGRLGTFMRLERFCPRSDTTTPAHV